MYIPQVAVIGVQPDWPAVLSAERHIEAEIAVLDKSFSRTHPLLYQLHLEALPHEVGIALSLQRYGHLIYGEVRSLDKTKKEIVLADMSTIHYRYLIVICGEGRSDGQRDVELASGLATLRGTLKMQDRFANAIRPATTRRRTAQLAVTTGNHDLSELIAPHLLVTPASANALQPRYLYEVQT